MKKKKAKEFVAIVSAIAALLASIGTLLAGISNILEVFIKH
jgi:hypothetical protein